ncbi:MAG TPA: hypothetical protein VG388_14495 [Solirubrobacteraceae bacterium]|nr:hypothetical protein [Solirubrobacteraceae bacterium]
MHEGDAPRTCESAQPTRVAHGSGGDRRQPARREQRPAHDRERADEDLDAGIGEVAGELATVGKDDERRIAGAVEPGGDERELAVRAVAAARGMQQQDGAGAQSSTVSASPGPSGTRSG